MEGEIGGERSSTLKTPREPNDLLELGEERRGRRLPLHEPAVIELHLRLREAHRALVGDRELLERGQLVRVVVEDVRERAVVVVDRVARLEAKKGRVLLLDHW